MPRGVKVILICFTFLLFYLFTFIGADVAYSQA